MLGRGVALYFNSEAKQESFLGIKYQSSGKGGWIFIANFNDHASAERYISQRGMDRSKCKIISR